MPIIPTGLINHEEVEAGVDRAAQALAETVVRIRYDFGVDWTGDPSIFFRIVLRDEVASKSKLSDIAQLIALSLMREVRTEEQGFHAYFNFRSNSEQAKLKEAAWA